MGQNEVPEGGLSQEKSTEQMMREVMGRLKEGRRKLGVLSVAWKITDESYKEAIQDTPDTRIDFFIAPVDVNPGNSIEDGGEADFVFVKPAGFFAIRLSGTEEGKREYDRLQKSLSGIWTENVVVFDNSSNISFGRRSFDGFTLSCKYLSIEECKEIGDEHTGYDKFAKIVPVGEEIVNRAFEASKERARELFTVEPKTGIRLQQSQQAARSLLDKMKEG